MQRLGGFCNPGTAERRLIAPPLSASKGGQCERMKVASWAATGPGFHRTGGRAGTPGSDREASGWAGRGGHEVKKHSAAEHRKDPKPPAI